MKGAGPARILQATLWRAATHLLGTDLAEEVLGDLLEEAAAKGCKQPNLRISCRALVLAFAIRARRGSAHGIAQPPKHLHPTTESKPMIQQTPPSTLSKLASSLHSIRLDIAQTLRSLRRAPALSFAVLLTLTLGIGATTAMYTVVRGVLLRPLPFEQPENLVRLGTSPSTAAHVAELRALDSLTGLTAVGNDVMVLDHDGTAVELAGLVVDGQHHTVFGVGPTLGRRFEPKDSLPGAEPVVVLSQATWKRYFDSDPKIVGQTIRLSGQGNPSHTVIGVQTASYRANSGSAEFLVPHRYYEGSHEWKDMARFWAVGRTVNGVSHESLQLEARTLIKEVVDRGGAFNRQTVDDFAVVGLLDARVGSIQRSLWLLFAVVGVVLVIGCANVANLVLVRGMARSQEFSLRVALGAGRTRLARQMITEGLVLSSLGGVLGIGLAAAALPTILASLPEALPRASEIRLDPSVLIFAGVVTILVGLVFGLIPMARLSWGQYVAGPRGGSQGRSSRRIHDVLLAGQIAMSLALLTSCGLLVASLVELQRVDPGFEIAHLHSFRINPPSDRYPEARRAAYFAQLEQALLAVPGVTESGAISNLPLTPAGVGVGISPHGNALPDSERPMSVSYRAITPGYITAAKVPLLRGRNLTPADTLDSEPVGLVNRQLAERLWPNQDPIGRNVTWSTGEPWFKVVGVIGDVHQIDLATEAKVEAYLPLAQEAWLPGMYVLARTHGSAVSSPLLLEALQTIDPMVPITNQRTMHEVLEESMSSATFNAYFISGFAVLGLLLATIGVYGVTLFVVSQRTKELGVRMALGADAQRIVGHVVRANLPAVGLGLIAGLGLAWTTSRSLNAMLFATQPHDPWIFVLAVFALGGGALAVSGLAAGRAGRLDPNSVLGSD